LPAIRPLGEDGWQPDPLILDDQALVLSLGDRGLVVLSGCGHAGIVNTVRYARRLTGQDKVGAIVGGFHLSGPMFEQIIGPTVEALAELSPSLLVPAHCTGWRVSADGRTVPRSVRHGHGRHHDHAGISTPLIWWPRACERL
jgi:7,8-dihydropterin-6-yl-methyl-4-(beta-D-ribofuranosyl)aminobenzene 5'-phosphate synthase